MRTLICLAVLLAFIQSNSAIKCYMCLGSLKSDCKQPDVESKVIQKCDTSDDKKALWFEEHVGFKAPEAPKAGLDVCVKVDVDDSELMSNFMQRSCGYTYDNEDICDLIIASIPEVRNCEWCVGDLCNL